MPVSKDGFKRLARKLLGSTFVEFSGPITFINKGEFDYATQSSVDTEVTMPNCIVTTVTNKEVSSSEDIQVGDKKILLEFEGAGTIKSDNTQCMIDGVLHDIKISEPLFSVIYKLNARVV